MRSYAPGALSSINYRLEAHDGVVAESGATFCGALFSVAFSSTNLPVISMGRVTVFSPSTAPGRFNMAATRSDPDIIGTPAAAISRLTTLAVATQ